MTGQLQITTDYYPSLVRASQVEWPSSDWPYWHRYDDQNSLKYATTDCQRLTPACQLLIAEIARQWVPDGLFPDLTLHGAGMHMLLPGGFVAEHSDSEKHPLKNWYRKLNAILYLSECEGGDLIIDDEQIKPEPGKLVIFEPVSPHRVEQVTGGVRNSLSLFWWSLDGEGDSTRAQFKGTGT